MEKTAVISPCGQYRYVLTRKIPQPIRWNKPCLGIMLNPSKADAERNDPTILRFISFASRERCTSLTVVNLFGLRSTDPKELGKHPDPIGPENDRHIREQIEAHRHGLIIAAWGASPFVTPERLASLPIIGLPVYCFGKTANGSPKHPLARGKHRIPDDFPLEPLFSPAPRSGKEGGV